mgnify:CR=1 FL=1
MLLHGVYFIASHQSLLTHLHHLALQVANLIGNSKIEAKRTVPNAFNGRELITPLDIDDYTVIEQFIFMKDNFNYM